LLAADRVDAGEHHLKSLLTLRPDNPITETGVLSEFSRHGYSSRVGQRRADLAHQPLDPVIVSGPWLAAAAVAGYVTYKIVRSRSKGSGASSKQGATAAGRKRRWT
jgi:hypothetical protein